MKTSRFEITDLPDGSILRINSVRAGRDNDTYECIAENGVGEPARAIANLTILTNTDIKGFPKFIHKLQQASVEISSHVLLPCEVEADPKAKIYWLKDNLPVDLNHSRFSLYNEASLQILKAEESDNGFYECVAENSLGTAFAESIHLQARSKLIY